MKLVPRGCHWQLRAFLQPQKRHVTPQFAGKKSAAFCEMTLEKAFFTRGVSDCISGVVVLDVR